MNVNPQLFGLMVSDICSEFVRMGFKNIIFFLGHGGTDNINALRTSLQMVLRRNESMKDIAICLATCSSFSETSAAIFKQDGIQCDFHAGMGETSRMLYWKPELVHMERLTMDEPEIAKNLRSDQDWFEHREKAYDHPLVMERVTQKEEVKIGVMGFPERANVELGKKISDELIAGLVDLVDQLNNRF
jgi:creatinine amidohydrolase/Fe(II)-dependent formamide hydrolase-like protein